MNRKKLNFRSTLVLLSSVVISIAALSVGQAHEHKHTHESLTRAAYQLLNSGYLRTGNHGQLGYHEIGRQISQGVIDEDECFELDDTYGRDSSGNRRNWSNDPNWNSHFYHAKTGKKLDVVVAVGLCIPGTFVQYDAADRARILWDLAIEDYRDGQQLLQLVDQPIGASGRTRATEEFASAFRILGRVMHLLEDMTSPAHTHDDPHGQAKIWDCGGDADDFERWGWCSQNGVNGTFHIRDYVRPAPIADLEEDCEVDIDSDGTIENFGVPPNLFTCRLWASVSRLYDGKAAGVPGSLNPVRITAKDKESIAHAYIRTLANVTFDFTAFQVKLKDVSGLTDIQDNSTLKSMLRGSGEDDCGLLAIDRGLCEGTPGWWITGNHQDIGRTTGNCGSVERAAGDFREEWWIDGTEGVDCTITKPNAFDYIIEGKAYIENIGGEGANGNGDQGPFIPTRHPKSLYQKLYGTTANRQDPFEPIPNTGKSMLRIQGDVLYAAATAYGAGLIQAFVDEVTYAPVADAGGLYRGEACQVVTLDGSGSTDPRGHIVSYEWDSTNNGEFDISTTSPTYDFVYQAEFDGITRLRVTDDEGFMGEDIADVIISPDVTPPVIESLNASPSHLWPGNKKMISVDLEVKMDDLCITNCKIVSVESNMPEQSQTDHTGPDWEITGDLKLNLRAEEWHGNSPSNTDHVNRKYAVTVECADSAGNVTSSVVEIAVNPDPPVPVEPTDTSTQSTSSTTPPISNQATSDPATESTGGGAGLGLVMIGLLGLLVRRRRLGAIPG